MEGDPLASAAKGATLGVLQWSEEKVLAAAARFRNRELAFIQDAATISIVREERQSAEYARYKEFTLTPDTRIMIQMGLALRRIQADAVAVRELRGRIYRRFQESGLHLAQAVQAGVVALVMEELLKQGHAPARYLAEVQQVIETIDRFVWFVPKHSDVALDSTEISMRLRLHKPLVFVISAIGSAKRPAADIAHHVAAGNPSYSVRLVEADWQHHYVCIPATAVSPVPAEFD